MNILITGANGQLGREMRLMAQESADRYVFTDVTEAEGLETTFLDITDREAVFQYKCDNFYHPEADAGISLKDETLGIDWRIPVEKGKEPYNVPCREDWQGTPTGAYGRTKLHGEQHIIQSGCQYIILRTAWLFSEYGKNFVKTMLNLTASRPALKVVFDQVGTPTYALDLARAICTIVAQYAGRRQTPWEKAGIYHYSNEGVCSWFDFARMIAEYAGHRDCDIQPCHSDEFPSPVRRPAYSVLDKTKVKQTFGLNIPYWTDSLKGCLSKINNR